AGTPEQSALPLAKLALAQALHGERSDAQLSLKRLESEFGAAPLIIRGETVNGAQLARRLKQQIEALGAAAPVAEIDQTLYMGGLSRTGAVRGPSPQPGGVAWAQPVIASGALD